MRPRAQPALEAQPRPRHDTRPTALFCLTACAGAKAPHCCLGPELFCSRSQWTNGKRKEEGDKDGGPRGEGEGVLLTSAFPGSSHLTANRLMVKMHASRECGRQRPTFRGTVLYCNGRGFRLPRVDDKTVGNVTA